LAVLSEASVDMRPRSMPLPDVYLSRVSRGPGAVPAEAVALIVEVSSSTQDIDSGPKALLYAEQGVPEYWLIDVTAQTATRMWKPGPQGYAERDTVAMGVWLESATLPGLAVDTAQLL
jgi:Uma2 family endonuclease